MGRVTVVVGLGALLVVSSLAAYALVGAATRSVDVQDDAYVDSLSGNSTTTITVGDTVQWTWSGSNLHTMDNNGGSESFSSGPPQTSGSLSHTFNTSGTYNYICGVHGTAMQGAIIVQAAQSPTSTSEPSSSDTPLTQASSTAAPNATATRTPAAPTTTVAPRPASPAPPQVRDTPAASTPARSTDGGSLPSAGQGSAGLDSGFGVPLAGSFIAFIGLGLIALARKISR